MDKILTLEPFSTTFLEKSFYWCNDPVIQELIDGSPVKKEDQEKWYESLPTRKDYKIWGLSCNGVPIGSCGLKDINDISAEYFGYIGEKKYWGGLGTKLVSLVEEEVKIMNLSRIYLKVLLSNARAKHLYEKLLYIEYRKDEKFAYYYKDLL